MPINAEILKAHMNPAFVETGTYLGEGVAAAVEAGFGQIWTVDLEPGKRWEADIPPLQESNVFFATGDSAMFLAGLVLTLKTPATFWLDAHPVGYFNLLQPDLPLVNELLALSFTTRNPNDIVLIDDFRLFDQDDKERLKRLITLLWPDCVIDLIDSSIIPLDILRVRNLASP